VARFANCVREGQRFVGIVDGDTVHPLRGPAPMSAGSDYRGLERAERGPAIALSEVALEAPVLAPGKVICLGLNYLGHVTETKREMPTYPVLFTKFPDAIIGPEDPIVVPPESNQVDYEAELAVVIGRRARRVSAAEALDHVAGYTIANDITMRDYQYKSHQWLQGKTWPRSTPLGPWLVTGDEIEHGRSLALRLERNGDELQSSNTELMIFDVPTTIATLSEFVELQPGDVILTGTPDGVGFRRQPQVFLQPGDRVRVEIEGIGALENEVVAEDAD
jgi:acylpyruvate hydrolase